MRSCVTEKGRDRSFGRGKPMAVAKLSGRALRWSLVRRRSLRRDHRHGRSLAGTRHRRFRSSRDPPGAHRGSLPLADLTFGIRPWRARVPSAALACPYPPHKKPSFAVRSRKSVGLMLYRISTGRRDVSVDRSLLVLGRGGTRQWPEPSFPLFPVRRI